jgi:hypothetical protein
VTGTARTFEHPRKAPRQPGPPAAAQVSPADRHTSAATVPEPATQRERDKRGLAGKGLANAEHTHTLATASCVRPRSWQGGHAAHMPPAAPRRARPPHKKNVLYCTPAERRRWPPRGVSTQYNNSANYSANTIKHVTPPRGKWCRTMSVSRVTVVFPSVPISHQKRLLRFRFHSRCGRLSYHCCWHAAQRQQCTA